MIAVKANPDEITVTVVPSCDTSDNTVRVGIIGFEYHIDVVVFKQDLEFGFLCSGCAIVRFKLGKIALPFPRKPGIVFY
jgi:hypothetical protein